MAIQKDKIKVGITMGDPSGIGPAIIAKSLTKIDGVADFYIIGDEWVFNKISNIKNPRHKNWRVRQEFWRKKSKIKFIDLKNVAHKSFSFGKIRAEYGRASIEYLDKAIELIKNNEIGCLVTCPISKEAINKAGFIYDGHTEYFLRRTHTKNLVMMLLNKQLKFSLTTRHIPLKKVAAKLTLDALYKTILLTYQSLKKYFLVFQPRIVVCGLNPHASDGGVIGKEEDRVIKPTLEKLKSKYKMHIDGPYPSDVAIYKAKIGEYDCVIAMYHDQALIPLKLCNNFSGVNLTLGLPFVRTSPLHGTAFDIAKTPYLANPGSLIEAIRLAIKCTLNLKKD